MFIATRHKAPNIVPDIFMWPEDLNWLVPWGRICIVIVVDWGPLKPLVFALISPMGSAQMAHSALVGLPKHNMSPHVCPCVWLLCLHVVEALDWILAHNLLNKGGKVHIVSMKVWGLVGRPANIWSPLCFVSGLNIICVGYSRPWKHIIAAMEDLSLPT